MAEQASNINQRQALAARWHFRELGILAILVVMSTALALATRDERGSVFLTRENLLDVARQFSFVAIMAVGELMVILTGGIDLSVAACFALVGVVTAKVMKLTGSVPDGIAVGFAVAAIVGLINGALVVWVRLPPFIATLGTMSICRGVALVVSHGHPISKLPKAFTELLGRSRLCGLPVPVVAMIIVTALGWLLLARTRWGRYLYAVGGNEEAARFAGVNVPATKMLAYILAAITAAIASVLDTARLGTALSSAMPGGELDVIAAAVIGGASLMGGRGTALGVVLGASIMGVLRNGLVLLECPAYYRDISIGLVIIIAVALDRLRKD